MAGRKWLWGGQCHQLHTSGAAHIRRQVGTISREQATQIWPAQDSPGDSSVWVGTAMEVGIQG